MIRRRHALTAAVGGLIGGQPANPDPSGRRLLLLLEAAFDRRVVGEQQLPSRVTAMVGLGASGRVAVLPDDGRVSAGSVAG